MEGYPYVEVTYAPPGGGFERWRRIPVRELPAVALEAGGYNVFATVQRFANPEAVEGEDTWADLYFDLDAHGDAQDLARVLSDARKLHQFFARTLGLEGDVRFWFSGARGIHVLVNGQALGVQGRPDLHRVFRFIAEELRSLLRLETVDPAVYTARRMWRVPGTVHPSSRLFKVELEPSELELSPSKIRALAKGPRPEKQWRSQDAISDAAAWYSSMVKRYEELRISRPEYRVVEGSPLPPCAQDLLHNHLRVAGTRNKATLCLSTLMKALGWPQDRVERALLEWAKRTPKDLTSARGRRLEAATLSVIRTVYDHDDYYFSCSVMRGLGVFCPGRCEVVVRQEELPVEATLDQTGQVDLAGRLIALEVMVSGQGISPFLVPERCEVECVPSASPESRCSRCPVAAAGGKSEAELSERQIVSMTSASDTLVRGAMRAALRVPQNCHAARVRPTSYVGVQEVRLIPRPDEGEYVVRRGYYLSEGKETLRAGQEYRLEARPIPDPRSQTVVILIRKAEPISGSLAKFTLSEERREQLSRLFQPAPGQTIAAKMEEIHQDLERNVTRIWGRQLVAMAVDLTYHSVIGFRFQGETHRRGWLQTLIIGDTREGKSQIAERIRDHYGLGLRISGETASRTGLVYNLQESQGWFLSWGVIPMNDRRLVIIDEFGGLDEEEIALMSDLRSSGIAEVRRVVSAQTPARTRLIFITNPRTGRAIASYTYAVQAIRTIFSKSEDIARLDLAVAVKAGEVPPEVMNQHISAMRDVRHVYTADLCRDLVLWAWTRRPEQVIFTPDAEEYILALARAQEGTECDIPLVSAADFRFKLARVSAAVAARLFSAGGDGDELIVHPAHVEFAAEYMQELYRGLEYEQYARRQAPVRLADMERLLEEVQDMLGSVWPEVLDALMGDDYLSVSAFEASSGLERAQVKELFAWMTRRGLLRHQANYWRKTEAANRFLHWAAGQAAPAARRRKLRF